jgi:acyl-[acyl-carrier-protein]-phospholipid O-acyltransferase / long-chain-fatty-acid--[acyl-carrier-protein] ligase
MSIDGMLSLLIFILATALFIYGSLQIWPNRTLWWYLEWQDRQHYRVHFADADYHPESSMLIIARAPDLRMAALLKRITHLPVYCINLPAPASKFAQYLLKNAGIEIITGLPAQPLQGSGLFLVAAQDYPSLKSEFPVSIINLAGGLVSRRTRMRWHPRDLQLTLQRFNDKEGPLDLALQHLSVHAWEQYVDKLPSIIETWLDQAKALGNRLSIADSTGLKLSHHRLIAGVMTLHHKLFNVLADNQHVGICLPNSVAGTMTLLSLLSLGKTVTPLNYTANHEALKAAVTNSGLTKVITSKQFIETLKRRGFPIDELFKWVTPIYLEDLKASMKKQELIKNYLIAKYAPAALLRSLLVPTVASSQVAFILFSSGSEGQPKGVELTHCNIIGNVRQTAEILAAETNDILLSVLPTFHAFGLTAGMLLPLMEGFCVISHPDPTDTATIGMLAQQYHPTLLFATSTFLRLYTRAKNITPAMFMSLRIVVAGAERLQPEVHTLFEEKFKKTIYEGYGTTELSPVASVNRPDTPQEIRQKIGSVGKPIVGCMFRIIDPDTGATLAPGEAGLILVGGVNVMKGYLHDPMQSEEVIIYEHGIRWYKTGDKGRLDSHGFLTILDRYSRFAKIGGETISLTAIEQQIMALINHDDIEILAVAVPDAKKGESIVLLHSGPLNSDELQNIVAPSNIHNLMKPSRYKQVSLIPKLGTGKTDFAGAKALAFT